MLPVVRTDQAEADLAEILEYLDQHSPLIAERVADAFDDRFRLLAQFPEMGRAREELSTGLRSVVVEHYVIFYRVTASAVELIRILHEARDIGAIMKTE